MTDEQIINSLNHLAEQKYLRVASRSVCKHAADRIEELEAKLAKVVAAGVRVRNYYENHGNSDVYAVSDFNAAIAELKGEKGGADCNGISTPTPLDDPRVKALVDAAKAAEAVLSQYYVGNRAIAKRKLRKALSAMEENK